VSEWIRDPGTPATLRRTLDRHQGFGARGDRLIEAGIDVIHIKADVH
jgi:hypothetical protein